MECRTDFDAKAEDQKVILSKLTTESCKIVWDYLRSHQPNVAAGLDQALSNEIVKSLIDSHNVELTFDNNVLTPEIIQSIRYQTSEKKDSSE